jgi:HAD superfamily hydrolase (TIGR01509 family)
MYPAVTGEAQMQKADGGVGLLFDIDGTLADTDHFHMLAFNNTMAKFGVKLDAEGYKLGVMGRTNEAIFGEFVPGVPPAEQMQIAAEKEAAFRALARTRIAPTPGLLDLLAWAQTNEVPCACVTNAPRLNAELILSSLALQTRFAALVLADDLPHGKPHPLPYQTGAARIGAAISRCVAFEDSRSGVQSAAAAGAVTVGVMSGLGEAALLDAGAVLAVRDFSDPRIMTLIERTLGL